jgi:hypothetical protein
VSGFPALAKKDHKIKHFQMLNPKHITGRSVQRRWAGGLAMVVVSVFALDASGKHEYGYLPAVGPVPLRFVEVNTNFYVFDPELFALKVKTGETNSSLASTVPTNAAPPMPTPRPMAPTLIEAVSTPNQQVMPSLITVGGPIYPGQNFNSDFSPAPASDLLPVTSSMITDYLKSDRNQTEHGDHTNNLDQPGAVVFVPAQIQFTPPTPTGGGESKAIYRSQ